MRASLLGSVIVTAGLLVSACASTKSSAPAGAPPSPQASQSAAAKPAGARTAAQIPMSEIIDDPRKLAILKKHAPSSAANPRLPMTRNMTLGQVAEIPQAELTPQMVQAIVDDINKL